jgi:3-deoxy-D-manno-octulosonic acid kinase
MSEIITQTDRGAMIRDPELLPAADESVFDARRWPECDTAAAGRGEAYLVGGDAGRFALRHYHRGGLAARLTSDRFLWMGASRSRPFREWRLLAELQRLGLPAPRPAAGRYQRSGLTYSADLLTVLLPSVVSLAQRLRAEPLPPEDWRAIGRTLGRFHAAGVCHADLNAHNIQLGADGEVYLLDFDRGAIRTPGGWRAANIERLKRSLAKLAAEPGDFHWTGVDWAQLLAGYRD